MSNLQLLQQLKQRINCSSPVALQLLKQTDNDLAKAEQLFHEQNLDFIQQQANCDRELAEKFYHRCQQNVEEAIAQTTGWILHGRISKSVITTADEKYSAHPHRLCFILTARDKMIIVSWILIRLNKLIPLFRLKMCGSIYTTKKSMSLIFMMIFPHILTMILALSRLIHW